MSSYSSFWRVECRRVLSCRNGRRKSGLKGRCLILTGGSRALRATVQQAICRDGSTDSLAQALSAQRRVKSPLFGALSSQKRRCGQCPHLPSQTGPYSRRTGPDSSCFREFPVLPSLGIPFESHLGHGIPARQRGGFLL